MNVRLDRWLAVVVFHRVKKDKTRHGVITARQLSIRQIETSQMLEDLAAIDYYAQRPVQILVYWNKCQLLLENVDVLVGCPFCDRLRPFFR